jgi:hypothetical protein
MSYNDETGYSRQMFQRFPDWSDAQLADHYNEHCRALWLVQGKPIDESRYKTAEDFAEIRRQVSA